MQGSSAFRGVLITAIVVAALAVLRFKPWQRAATAPGESAGGRAMLRVGFLPVT